LLTVLALVPALLALPAQASIGPVEVVHIESWSRREQVTLGLSILAVALIMYLALRFRDRRRRQHIAALQRLSEIALAIASVPGQDLRPLLDRLAAAARQLLGMPMSRVLLLDENQPRIIRVVHDYGLGAVDSQVRARTEYHLDESPVTEECLRSGKAIIVTDAHRDPHGMNRNLLDVFGVRALAVTPLRAGGKSIGVLLLADGRPRRISEADRRLIELWGAQAAVSIVNNRLYQQMDEAIRSLRHFQAQRDTLYDLSTAVQSARTLDDVLARVADLAPTGLDMDVCAVCLRDAADADTGAFRIAAVTKLPYAFPLTEGTVLYSTHAARAMSKHRAVALEDASQDRALRELRLPFNGSALYVPLTGRGHEAIGVLVLLRRQPGAIGNATIRMTEMFCQRAANSIENARLHEQARRDADAKATLLHELNHRVKNNLASLVGLLSMGTPDMPPEAQRWLDRVIERINAMARAHDLFSAGAPAVPLRELIDTTLDSVAAVKPEHVRVIIELDPSSGDVVLPADSAVPLAMVVYELAYNALVHGAGEAGELRVRAARAGDAELRIEIIDDGGHSAQLVGAQVGAEARADSTVARAEPELRRSGVGLSLVRGLVARELRGTFALRRGAEGGTIAAISFPLDDATEASST
jgi:two-component sensor histidine kinase